MTSDSRPSLVDSDLPRRVYLDTQFVFAFLVDSDPDHNDAIHVVKSLKAVHRAGLISGFVSLLVLDELAWGLAGTLFDMVHGEGAWRRADRDRALLHVRQDVAEAIDRLLREPWLQIASADEESCSKYASFMQRFPLRPADLAHLVIADSCGMDAILTHHSDFHALKDSPVKVLSYRRNE